MKVSKSALFLTILLLFGFSVFSQKHRKSKKISDFSVTASLNPKSKGTQLVLKQVISDARCPEGLACVWAGEAQVLVSVYRNRKWMDEEILSFSPKTIEKNRAWISQTMAIPLARIKSVRLMPYPKDSIKIDPKSYQIKVEMQK